MSDAALEKQGTLFGHPTGLFVLFFAEMWERFSYYGMRALLLLYLMKGFLGFGDKDATAIYGAYTALVYMTPFFGGMIADKLLGSRISVVIGGVLMAGGHLLMMFDQSLIFFVALAFIIVGNGLFKPNISTIVGELYPEGSGKRDSGFTIFYIGVNLGAAMAPLLCGYIGETYGWHYGFGLATIGMLAGLAVFVAPTIVTQGIILCTAVLSCYSLLVYKPNELVAICLNVFVGICLLGFAVASVAAIAKGGIPDHVGRPPKSQTNLGGSIMMVLIGIAVVIPVITCLVSGGLVIPGFEEQVSLIPHSVVENLESSENPVVKGLAEFVKEMGRPAGLVLGISGIIALGYLLLESFKMSKVGRERMYVVLILTFFSLLFWAFFEQAGSSFNAFTDRNMDRVSEDRLITKDDIGKTEKLRIQTGFITNEKDKALEKLPQLTQEYLGRTNGDPSYRKLVEKAIRYIEDEKGKKSAEEIEKFVKEVNEQEFFGMTQLTYLREYVKKDGSEGKDKKVLELTEDDKTIQWKFIESNVGIGFGGSETPASVYQAVNPVYIIIFGLIFSILWTFLSAKGMEPSTPVKFSLGLIQLGLGFASVSYGAANAGDNGMVFIGWLFLFYLLNTTGELCLSPVGLSMITKLSPARLVSTAMGTWFLATAFSQFLAAILAQFAAVPDGAVPKPLETVVIYGRLYQIIAYCAIGSGVICLLMSPILKRWMHEGEPAEE